MTSCHKAEIIYQSGRVPFEQVNYSEKKTRRAEKSCLAKTDEVLNIKSCSSTLKKRYRSEDLKIQKKIQRGTLRIQMILYQLQIAYTSKGETLL